MVVPDNPKIFHIVHIDHLGSIVRDGALFSYAIMSQRSDNPGTNIGMGHIKERRMLKSVGDSAAGTVGEYVPFYFCPRSVMLYIMYKGDHPDITYRGGQAPVIHLVSDMDQATSWAAAQGRSWAFTNANASTGYVQFFHGKHQLNELRWDLIKLRDFRPQQVSEAKHSEFLVKDSFAWELITGIVVYNEATKRLVEEAIKDAKHKPIVKVCEQWYY